MSRRSAPRLVPWILCAAAVAAMPAASRAQQEPPAPAGTPKWMAPFEASKEQPVGIDESALRNLVEKTFGGKWPSDVRQTGGDWDQLWKDELLVATPSWKAQVPAFAIGRYEVTNAQWEKFLEYRTATYTTKAGDTLEGIATDLWGLNDQGAEIQRGWQSILARNPDKLVPVLNPSGVEKWDPLATRAAQAKLPAGIVLSYTRYMPPPHWTKGQLPDVERKRPMHFMSWEQAEDFCNWAGFHLPTEAEWERAARGTTGRLYPWGDSWDPLRVVWKKYNENAMQANDRADKAYQEAKAKDPTASPPTPLPYVLKAPDAEPERETPCPADVDSFPEGGTPEGVLHLIGNVYEFTAGRFSRYPGSKTSTHFFDGSTCVARGGSFGDTRPELLVATDRNVQSHAGTLLPSHKLDSYGFRLAAYPLPAMDLTIALDLRWNDDRGPKSLWAWLPPAAGFDARGNAAENVYLGFDSLQTAGVLTRQIVAESPDHTFVTGPASGIAFLPVKGFPAEKVKTVRDLERLAQDPERGIVLGILTGTEDVSFRARENDTPEAAQNWFSLGDARFRTDRTATPPRVSQGSEDRSQTEEMLGALLVLERESVAVYAPNGTLRGKKKFWLGRLGIFEVHPEFSIQKGLPAPTAKVERVSDGSILHVETSIPFLGKNGQAVSGSLAQSIRVKVQIRFRNAPAR